MGSLFDLAADLSQYADVADAGVFNESRQDPCQASLSMRKTAKPTTSAFVNREVSPSARHNNQETGDHCSQVSALSLLDEALLTIYEARQPQLDPNKCTSRLIHQRSAPDLHLTAARSIDNHSDGYQLKTSHKTSRSPSHSTSTPLQSVFSQSLATKTFKADSFQGRIPPPPPAPPTATSTSVRPEPSPHDPDVEARTALREFQEEVDQLLPDTTTTLAQTQRYQRVLSDKYLDKRLSNLASTPFVLLAKRKIQQKIDQLTRRYEAACTSPEVDKPATTATLPTAQHEKLVKLALIPESHVAKLSSTQQKMVQFAKRYDKILKLSSEELKRLPVSQAQLLQQLKDQIPKAT